MRATVRQSEAARYQMDLLSWLVDSEVWETADDIPEEDLDEPFRQAVDAMRRASGHGPRFVQAIELLTREGKHEAARAIDTAARTYPTQPLEDVVASIRAIARLRRLQEAASRVLRIQPGDDPAMAACTAEACLAGAMVARQSAERSVRSVPRIVDDLLAEDDAVYVPSGIDLIDDSLGGWRCGSLHIVLGLTGAGKSALLLQSAAAAARAGFHVHIVSAEMSGEDLVPRLLGDQLAQCADEDGAPITVERAVRRDPAALQALQRQAERHRRELERISVDDRGWQSLPSLLSALYARHVRQPVHLLFVDYLQLLQTQGRDTKPREQQVREVAEALKRLAMQLRIAVVAAAQLVDPPAWGEAPQRSSTPAVRESRAAAHAADLVVELTRSGERDAGRTVVYELRILKARMSARDSVQERVVFDRWSCRFLSGRELQPVSPAPPY